MTTFTRVSAVKMQQSSRCDYAIVVEIVAPAKARIAPVVQEHEEAASWWYHVPE